ncbi:hypothetical protein CLV54_2853 [Compostimonas suwonensis]|uniref:Uncharacterized protein n=2 Tax=Compostimonas suwonensis TaxID=1048394 RepID=A0A2M9BC38_9MICO|nr:hypothetical protein CLV54_2853 [Compostimonas suwonensis]
MGLGIGCGGGVGRVTMFSMSEPESKGPVVAAVVGTLLPGDVGKPFTDADRIRAMVSHDWQMLGAQYEWAEIHGVSKGLPHGYFADLLGRAAAAGEQLGLAFAALRDAEVWRDTATEPATANHRNIAGRAVAEASGLWAVSAGHAVVNVVARVVRIHSKAAGLDVKLSWTGLPAPFDSGRLANLSLNPETVKYILAAARQTGKVALADLVEPLDDLVKSAAWAALAARRDAGYHRLRPQSIEGGVPSVNPWATDQAAGTLTLSVSTFSDYVPPVLEEVVTETHAGYEALSSAMRDVHDRLPEALRAAGVPIYRTP